MTLYLRNPERYFHLINAIKKSSSTSKKWVSLKESSIKRSISLKKYWSLEENRQKHSKVMKKIWENDLSRKKYYADLLRNRIERSESFRNTLKDYFLAYPEENKRKGSCQKGEKNNAWRGGTSCLPYDNNFTTALKKEIRKRDSFKCRVCQKEEKHSLLHVHHIDYDKKNSSLNNLITLCHSCHEKTNGRREYWKKELSLLMSSIS